jgi:hypothetical protein
MGVARSDVQPPPGLIDLWISTTGFASGLRPSTPPVAIHVEALWACIPEKGRALGRCPSARLVATRIQALRPYVPEGADRGRCPRR